MRGNYHEKRFAYIGLFLLTMCALLLVNPQSVLADGGPDLEYKDDDHCFYISNVPGEENGVITRIYYNVYYDATGQVCASGHDGPASGDMVQDPNGTWTFFQCMDDFPYAYWPSGNYTLSSYYEFVITATGETKYSDKNSITFYIEGAGVLGNFDNEDPASSKAPITSTDTSVSQEILDKAKNKSKSIKIFAKAGDGTDYQWLIAPDTITSTASANLDLGLTITSSGTSTPLAVKIGNSAYCEEFTITGSGELGYTAVLTLPVSGDYVSKQANLFYKQADGSYLYLQSSPVEANTADSSRGFMQFSFTHLSDYAIVITDEAYDTTTSPETIVVVEETEEATEEMTATADLAGEDAAEAETAALLISPAPSSGNKLPLIIGIVVAVVVVAGGVVFFVVRKKNNPS